MEEDCALASSFEKHLNEARLLSDYLNSCPLIIENRKKKRVKSFLFALLLLHFHRTEVNPTNSSFYYFNYFQNDWLKNN